MELPFGPASEKQAKMLHSKAKITVVGGAAGSGKSFIMSMHPLQYIQDPKFNAIFFRRTTKQISGQGGLFDTARDMYSTLPEEVKPRFREKDYTAFFPSGAKIKWSHMEHEKNRIDHQGLQYSAVYYDEASHFSWPQIEYLISRLRSEAKNESYMYMSCNPDPDCEWLMRLVEWYLDEEGFPDPEKDGVIRWFIRRDGDFYWANSREECVEKYGLRIEGKLLPLDHKAQVKPISFTFISATIHDNPPMMEMNPDYYAFLEGLNPVDKARLLHGNWYARPAGANYFDRTWLERVDELPDGVKTVRAWDKASEEPNDVNKYPDFTASVKMSKCKNGFYYIHGATRFQKRPGVRDMEILSTAQADGTDTYIVGAVDPGSAGKFEFQEWSKKLFEEGFVVKKDPKPSNKSKLLKFEPFAVAAQNGLVKVVESEFESKETLEQFYKELEAFDGERSTSTRKDDWADSCASAFNTLAKERVIAEFSLSQFNAPSPTKYKQLKEDLA